MTNKALLLLLSAGMLLCFHSVSASAQSPNTDLRNLKECPKPPRSPFRYVVLSNEVDEFTNWPGGSSMKKRSISILIQEKTFSENTLKELFELVSKKFPSPFSLSISVYTNLDDVYTPEEAEFTPLACTISDLDSIFPDHEWANYIRENERESFFYFQKKLTLIKEVVLRRN